MTDEAGRKEIVGEIKAPRDAFAFGKNWQRYLERDLTPERERIAADSLGSLLDTDLASRTFLDIGCGSGLFSLSAHRAGARLVTSLDVDTESVAATRSLHAVAGAPETWRVIKGSILDDAVVGALEPADVVYAWGVLHHTGDMHRALRNSARLVAPGGLFCIAIYNRVTGRHASERWLRIKRRYNRSSRPLQFAMRALYGAYWVTATLVRRRRNPLREAREYKASRGMALRTDMVDWLGGYPYEFATADEIVQFCEDELGLRRRKVIDVGPGDLANNQFVFEKPP